MTGILKNAMFQVQALQLQFSKGQALDAVSVRNLLTTARAANPYPRQTALYVATEAGLFAAAVLTQPSSTLPYAPYWLQLRHRTLCLSLNPCLWLYLLSLTMHTAIRARTARWL